MYLPGGLARVADDVHRRAARRRLGDLRMNSRDILKEFTAGILMYLDAGDEPRQLPEVRRRLREEEWLQGEQQGFT